MKTKLTIWIMLMALTVEAQTSIKVTVNNPTDMERSDEPVVVSLKKHEFVSSAVVKNEKGDEVPCQLDDLDCDEVMDELCFLTNLKANEKQTFTITLRDTGEQKPYEPRVYTEMLMRNDKVKEKNKHNNFIESITARGDCANPYNLQHHHGVSFESELNCIRIYFDKRQTPDLYGKFKKRLELKQTQFYTSAEQKKEQYGDDVLWVGNTFGLGAFRGWDGSGPTMIEPVRSRTQRIVSYGPLRTIVEVEDRGWKTAPDKTPVNMTIRYTQYAGHRDTNIDIFFSKDVSDRLFSTGIIDVKGSEEFSDHEGLRACWGTDWPAGDTVNWKRETVGLAIMLSEKNVAREVERDKKGLTEQGHNYTFVVKSAGNRLSYKVAYCSANEEFGFKNADEWFQWVKTWKRRNEQPAIIRLR